MYKEDIQKLNKWFRKKEKETLGTYHHTLRKDGEDVYVVKSTEMEEFTKWLKDNVSDLIGFSCTVGYEGIWFSSKDLEKSKHY